jgi:SNF2 family DNA or RNA helicase
MEYLIEPWAHQKEAIERAKKSENFALFFAIGTGKTGTTINILRQKYNQNQRVMRTLILCPQIVISNWRHEFTLHSKIPGPEIVLLKGSGKQRVQTFQKMIDQKSKYPIVVTNYEALLMDSLYQSLLQWQPECLVLDESHKCKDLKSKRTKLAVKLSMGAKHRYILSGTPVLNSPMDLFSQFLILDQGLTFGKNFFAFRARYFRDKNSGMPRDRYFPMWVVREGALEEMNQLIFQNGMRVTKSECLDLPPLVRQVIQVELGPEQARLYREMKQEFITFMKDKAVTASLAMTKALRLMQISSGYVKTVEGDELEIEDNPKLDALEELLSEITPHSKCLVWACWKNNYAEIRRVCEKLRIGYTEVHGETPVGARDIAIERINHDPSCRVFIGHPGAAGIGCNLVGASYSIFYSRNFSYADDLQAEGRNYRSGCEQHEKITRIDLVSTGTIDELVAASLARKEAISETILKKWVEDEADLVAE